MLISLTLLMTAAAPLGAGQMACVVHDVTRNKVLLSRQFDASSGTEASKYEAFIAAVRGEGYLPESSQIEGGCIWASSADGAAEAVAAYRNKFPSANQLTVPFS